MTSLERRMWWLSVLLISSPVGACEGADPQASDEQSQRDASVEHPQRGAADEPSQQDAADEQSSQRDAGVREEGREPPGQAGRICPTCSTHGGGETADFGGTTVVPPCEMQEGELTPEVAQRFGLEDLIPRLEAGLETEAERWRLLEQAERWHLIEPEEQAPLPGDGPTAIELHVEFGELEYRISTSSDCSDRVSGPVTVSARVGGDLLELSADGHFLSFDGGQPPRIEAVADLADVRGTLELPIDTERVHAGRVQLAIEHYAGTFSGQVIATLLYFADEQALASWDGNEWAVADRHRPVALEFPADDCDGSSVPLALDEASGLLGERTPREVLSEAEAGMQDLLVQSGRWDEDHPTEVTLELHDLAGDTVCAGPGRIETVSPWDTRDTRPVTALRGWPGTRVRSDDGIVDLELETALQVSIDDGAPRQAYFSRFIGFVSFAELAELGIDLPNNPGETTDALSQVFYTFGDDAVSVEGEVLLRGGRTACLAWPVGGVLDEDCTPSRTEP
ncbi:MAG: hypothetical protein OXT09_16865 [Myxococcales bacterium]|nr:hypothetical protein [Myxococcales bacterium]